MKVVIDIPKPILIDIKRGNRGDLFMAEILWQAVVDGVVLPEHHGRLIDSTIVEKNIRTAKLLEEVTDEMIVGLSVALDFCLDAPTVLESSIQSKEEIEKLKRDLWEGNFEESD